MRIVCGIAAVVMVLFVLVQINDPDPLLWMSIYAAAAFWAGVGALRPELLARPAWRSVYLVSLAAAAVGLAWFWPRTPQWWVVGTWWENEESREGMGMMLVLATMLLVGAGLRRRT